MHATYETAATPAPTQIAPIGETLPQAGVMATRPATAAVAPPSAVGFPRCSCSITAQTTTAVDAAVHAGDEAIQIHGGYGFTVEYHVERHYRDAKTLEVLDGGTDALRDAIAV